MRSTSAGYTVIEILIVLAIVTTITFVSLIPLKNHVLLQERNLFLFQIKADLLFAQQYAISHQKEVTVNIMPSQHYYYIRERIGGRNILDRHYSSSVKVVEGSISLYFHFLPDGNSSKFGSFYIYIGNDIYRLTILIGKGRINIVKQ